MSATERLYYNDSRLLEFDARVIDLSERDDGAVAVTLDRTAFYPTGGGQPNDTGTLGEARVVDCIDAEDAGVLHVIQGPTPEIGDNVHGKIDRLRRLDHMQQHTGQHILSAAFVKLFNAPTRSFRVLEHECEIDVALDNPSDERIEQAVDLANQVIWECRRIQIRQVTSAEAATLPLRKEPAREGELRVIGIDDFDLTPCGGTHAKSTGEVGVIAVRSWERAKGLTRIQFMAGIRVLNDYRKANKTATDVAALFSAGRDDTPALVAKLIDENKKLARRVRELDEIACRVEAEELLKDVVITDRGAVKDSSRGLSAERDTPGIDHKPISDPERVKDESAVRIVARVFADRDADSLKHLALALVTYSNVVALLGSRDGDTARLVFARSADAPGDMNALMRRTCEMIDGRGGGKPDLAQGGGKNAAALDESLQAAAKSLSQS
ncbi:MAG TPA: DHHA1 domain-containing protein [Pyrinomonadaceae bacterium]|nr:DHHA1 domain-containing protein [Pyrinomonadaceae bacterium]